MIVRALLANDDGALKPGMFLNVSLANDEREALVDSRGGAHARSRSGMFVFVVADGKAARREVRIGGRRPGTSRSLAGLTAGERWSSRARRRLRDGATCAATSAWYDVQPPANTGRVPHEASASRSVSPNEDLGPVGHAGPSSRR